MSQSSQSSQTGLAGLHNPREIEGVARSAGSLTNVSGCFYSQACFSFALQFVNSANTLIKHGSFTVKVFAK